MKRIFGRRLFALGFGLVALPVAAASLAYACIPLTTLALNPTQGDPGQIINGGGKGFGTASSSGPVMVRLDNANGPLLWSGRPDPNGNLNFTFQVPRVGSGSYAVLALQNNVDGRPQAGTPARAEFTVTGQQAVAPPQQTPAPPQGTSTPAPAGARQSAAATAPAPAGQAAPSAATSSAVGPDVVPATGVAPGTAPAVAPGSAPAVSPVPAVVGDARSPAGSIDPSPRSTMVQSRGSTGSPVLPLVLVGAGLLVTLAATASAIAARREDKGVTVAGRRR